MTVRTKTMMMLAAFAALSACDAEPAPDDGTTTIGNEPIPDPDAPVSILRPEVEQPEPEPEPLEPLKMIVGFPDGGAELDSDAVAVLEEAVGSEQLAAGGSITLGAHSDSGGSDDANARASQARGLAVAEWLIANGVDDDRIEVIVFGEQNPVQPNALPDGAPNEVGRAANRRVEIDVALPVESEGTEDISVSDETESAEVSD